MHNKDWFKSSYRRNLVDMHIDAWSPEFLRQFSPDEYLYCLVDARIQSAMIYLNSHVGYCNWPSVSGEMHPNFKGNDQIGRLIDLCHEKGIDVIAYYSLIYNNWAYDRNPEWRMINLNGDWSRSTLPAHQTEQNLDMMNGLGRYGLVCPNSRGYRQFLSTQIEEFCGRYTFEGVFLDMTFWPMICYCDSCRERFRSETGQDLPEMVDWADPRWLEFQDRREQWIREFAEFSSAEIKRHRPDSTVEHQFSTCSHPWTFGVRTGVSDAGDYSGGDLYGGIDQQSFICKAYYATTKNQPFEYMTSRCDPSLYDHTTTKTERVLKQHAYLTYAHHGAFLIIDGIDPRGTLDRRFYQTMGEVFRETSAYEPFYRGELTADIGIYYSLASKMDIRNTVPARAVRKGDEANPGLQCALGAGTALKNAHIPYIVVTDGRPADMDNAKVMVFSDVATLTSEEEEAIVAYVEGGGNAYISGITSKTLVHRLLGLEIDGQTRENVTYIRPEPEFESLFCDTYNRFYPMTIFGRQLTVQNPRNRKVLAYLTLPYTDPSDLTTFASIHSNPPGIDTDIPSIVFGEYGSGGVIWSSCPFESSPQPKHKQVFANLISMLSGEEPLVDTDLPSRFEFTVFRDTMANTIQLHCVDTGDGYTDPHYGEGTVKLRMPADAETVDRIVQLPERSRMDFEMAGQYAVWRMDQLDVFRMYEITYR